MTDETGKLLTVKEVMEIIPISRNQLYRDIGGGRIKPIYFGRSVRFRPDDVMQYKEYKEQSKKVQLWREKKKNSTQQKT